MRVLHVGWGFRPWRPGGLIAYAEDVMDAQARAGHAVAYFCAGRHYPGLRGPRLHRWSRRGVRIFEVLNSPLTVAVAAGTRAPEGELDEPGTERLFRGVLARVDPEVVHVHELAGVPSSLIEIAARAEIPTVFTLQDYFSLCPTYKLYDVEGANCRRQRPGAMCQRCCAGAPETTAGLRAETVAFERERLLARAPRLGPRVWGVARAARRRVRPPAAAPTPAAAVAVSAPPLPASPAAYDHRREVNVTRLNQVDALVAMSHRLAELYAELGVAPERLRTVHLTLSHLARLTPRRLDAPPRPVRFGTLNGAHSREKGADVLAGAVERLERAGVRDEYRLALLGWVDTEVGERIARAAAHVELRGPYGGGALDALLDDVDVGIVPSVWEEAYGYVGVELLAKGIPVIGNARGGISDYTRDGETGWLNRSASSEELAQIMLAIIRRPESVLELHRSVVERRSELIKPMDAHLPELEGIYREVIAARRRSPVAA